MNTALLYTCSCTGNGTSKIFVFNDELGYLLNTCDDGAIVKHAVSNNRMTAVKVMRLED